MMMKVILSVVGMIFGIAEVMGDAGECRAALGMEEGRIPDHAISASSSYEAKSVGPQNARIRQEKNGGAWCPKAQISSDVKEYLEVDLQKAHLMTWTETQGRFGNGQGQEFAEAFLVEYWRPSLNQWITYKDSRGEKVLTGNSNTYLVVRQRLELPFIASKVRFIPYSEHPRTVCMRVELYGCPWERIIYTQMMDGSLVLDDVERPDQICLIKSSESVALGLIRAIALMPSLSQLQMVSMINNFGSHRLARSLATTVNTVNKYGVNRVTVVLAAIFLTPKIIQCIWNWWKGEITGSRCCKIIIDEVSTVAGSVGGGYVGALIGIPLGPAGIIAGGIFGGMLGGELLSRFSDWLTQNMFNIHKDVALENAYVYFGIEKGASNHDINVAYRKKCMQHHPDKGGDSVEFHKVQIHMGTIKASKGQLYS